MKVLDYNSHVELVGTAHFTRRSIEEAVSKILSKKPKDIALELDIERYRALSLCPSCPKRCICQRGMCEFTAASEALGNMDVNIWLIDMDEHEVKLRIDRLISPREAANLHLLGIDLGGGARVIKLWERGYKDLALKLSEKEWQMVERYLPTIHRVLMLEREALMSARILWIISRKLKTLEELPELIAFVGAGHVKGIRHYLSNPHEVTPALAKFKVSFTPPTLVRRVKVVS